MRALLLEEEIPRCACGGVIKPDIVFFGENVKFHDESVELAESVELFFVVGTSCVVYPAASIPQFVRGQIVIVNQAQVKLPLLNIALSVQEDIEIFFKSVAEELKMK